jgi:hypothetical protein
MVRGRDSLSKIERKLRWVEELCLAEVKLLSRQEIYDYTNGYIRCFNSK